MEVEVRSHADSYHRREPSVIGWQRYYEAQHFLDQGSAGETTADLHLAELLGYAPLELLRNNMGANFLTVRDVRPPDVQGDSLSDVFAWFVHGDPWHVLLGIAESRLVVGSVHLSASGMAGPATLTCEHAESIPRDSASLQRVAAAIAKARRRTKRSMTLCPLCDSPRYGRGCTCDGPASGTIYD